MRKYLFVLLAASISFVSCQKDDEDKDDKESTNMLDEVAPVMALNEPENFYVIYGNPYTDPGVTAVDNIDEDPEVTVSGEIDENFAGEQTLVYTATDESGNSSTLEREVTVDASPYVVNTAGNANFSVDDNDPSVPVYSVEINSASITYNKIYIEMFAWYINATVYAELSGNNTVTIPEQIVNCGTDSQDRRFSGVGTFTSTTLIIDYTVAMADGTNEFSGTATYTKQ